MIETWSVPVRRWKTTLTDAIRLPLNALHRRLDARMVDFAGFEMPVQYSSGLKQEHQHTRQKCGLFDVSHMGQLDVCASDGQASTLHAALESALPIDFVGWAAGLQRYSVLLNEQGGIEDDLMVTNLGESVRMVVNAGNREADLAWLQAHCPALKFTWVDAGLIALQGPLAEAVLSQLDPAAQNLTFMQVAPLRLLGATCLTSRSGYTGEDGFEISIPAEHVEQIVQHLLAQPGVAPIGLGARDSLRLEAGLPLHGQDIGPDKSPVQAGLSFAIARTRRTGDKAGGFPGAQILLDQIGGLLTTQLVGLTSSANIPVRAGASIVDGDENLVGTVSSGTVSPTLNQPIMMAWLDKSAVDQGNKATLHAQVRNKRPVVELTKLPFVPKRYKR